MVCNENCSNTSFSGLFASGPNPAGPRHPPRKGPLPYGNVHYNAPTSHVSPAPLEAMRRRNLADRNANRRSLDFLDSNVSSDKLQQRRANERREQYKQVCPLFSSLFWLPPGTRVCLFFMCTGTVAPLRRFPIVHAHGVSKLKRLLSKNRNFMRVI